MTVEMRGKGCPAMVHFTARLPRTGSPSRTRPSSRPTGTTKPRAPETFLRRDTHAQGKRGRQLLSRPVSHARARSHATRRRESDRSARTSSSTMTNVPKPDNCMYVATQTVYVSCSASVPFFTWILENTAAVRRIATQYSFNSSSVGSDPTRSTGDVPGRTPNYVV